MFFFHLDSKKTGFFLGKIFYVALKPHFALVLPWVDCLACIIVSAAILLNGSWNMCALSLVRQKWLLSFHLVTNYCDRCWTVPRKPITTCISVTFFPISVTLFGRQCPTCNFKDLFNSTGRVRSYMINFKSTLHWIRQFSTLFLDSIKMDSIKLLLLSLD